ncbi:MAG: OmpA family protein [Pseudomonadota bacterium]
MKGVNSGAKRGLVLVAVAGLASLLIAAPASAADDCVRPTSGTVQTPKSIDFDLNSKEIKPQYQAQLTEIAKRYAGNPNIQLCVIGMTDRSGSADYNKKLAMERANAVADFLKSAGLKDNKYQIVARGQAFSDDSWVGKLLGDQPRESQRRVELIVMER